MSSLEYFFDQSPIALLITNLAGTILHLNVASTQLLGMQLGSNVQECFLPEDQREWSHMIQCTESFVRKSIRLSNVQNRPVDILCSVFFHSNRMYWMIEDVSVVLDLQRQLDDLKVLPREFGHEINNFLTIISSVSEVILMDAQSIQLEEDAQTILEVTRRAATHTRKFMNLGRKSLLPDSTLFMHTMIEENLSLFQDISKFTTVELRLQAPMQSQVFSSRWLMQQMFMSLGLFFRDKIITKCVIATDIVDVHNPFAAQILGVSQGKYLVLSFFDSTVSYSTELLTSMQHILYNEDPLLHGVWEFVSRSASALCQRKFSSIHGHTKQSNKILLAPVSQVSSVPHQALEYCMISVYIPIVD